MTNFNSRLFSNYCRSIDRMTIVEMKRIMKIYFQMHQVDNSFDWNDESFDAISQHFYIKFKSFIESATGYASKLPFSSIF